MILYFALGFLGVMCRMGMCGLSEIIGSDGVELLLMKAYVEVVRSTYKTKLNSREWIPEEKSVAVIIVKVRVNSKITISNKRIICSYHIPNGFFPRQSTKTQRMWKLDLRLHHRKFAKIHVFMVFNTCISELLQNILGFILEDKYKNNSSNADHF